MKNDIELVFTSTFSAGRELLKLTTKVGQRSLSISSISFGSLLYRTNQIGYKCMITILLLPMINSREEIQKNKFLIEIFKILISFSR